MFSKITTLNGEDEFSDLCSIETGVSQGIPVVRFIGNVSSDLVRSREKYQFIFAYQGRKLPGRKLRVCFLADRRVEGNQIDLAVITGIYMAVNGLEGFENIASMGEVGMDGVIREKGNYGLFLYLIDRLANGKKYTLFIPKLDNELISLYPNLNIQVVNKISDLFKYFEGRGEYSVQKMKSQINKESVEVRNLLQLATLQFGFNTLIGLAENSRNKLTDWLEKTLDGTEAGLRNRKLASIIDPINARSLVQVDNAESLRVVSKLGDQNILLIDCNKAISVVHKVISDLRRDNRNKVTVFLPNCICGNLHCTCTTRQLGLYRASVRDLAKQSDLTFWDSEGKIHDDGVIPFTRSIQVVPGSPDVELLEGCGLDEEEQQKIKQRIKYESDNVKENFV